MTAFDVTSASVDKDGGRGTEAEAPEPDSVARDNYETARRFLLLLQSRQEIYLASRGRAIDFSKAQGGGSRHRGPAVIDPLEQWNINVGWRLSFLGKKGAYILVARCTRRAKSAEVSWRRIAAEVQDTVEETRRIYEFAIAIFILSLEKDRITTDIADEHPLIPQHALEVCAATLNGQACAASPAI